ncbi:MAG: hypothetical protein K2J79_08170 [Ruminiclostridium sp.]|nr:hypothetical protein [Ruminiclostridium sp.]
MNGYKKMKRLAGMKVLKAVSAVTALSMTVTSLAVSASANSVTPDVISNALGDLKNYGIVTDSFTSANHFESNFAAKDVILNNNFDVDNYVIRGARKITFKITTDETFKEGETKTYTFGVFCNDKLIDVVYNGETRKGILAVEFDQAGDKTFTVTIPEEYRYETVRVYKMDVIADEDGVRYSTSEAGVDFLPDANSKEEMIQNNSECLVGGSLQINNIMIGENKVMNLLPEIYDRITQENDGRYSYKQGDYNVIIANPSNIFHSRPEAKDDVDKLLAQIKDASDTLSKVESGSNRVIFGELENSDIDYGTENQANIKVTPAVGEPVMKTIGELYNEVKANPDLTLLINVKLGDASYFNMKFHSNVDNWDVDTASRIVFNFIGGTQGVTSVYLGDGFRGTVIAPNARVVNESTILGAVYAPEVSNPGGEIHRASYRSFVDFYQAYFYDEDEVTTPVSEETEPTETTPEETEPEVTTVPDDTTATTTVDEGTDEATTATEPEVTTTSEVTTTTTTPEVTTTTTTPPPVVTTTTATTPPPVVTTTTTTTPPPVEEVTTTTTPAPVEEVTTTTTPAPVEEVTTTTTPAPVEEVTTTTTPAPVEEVTTTTTPVPVEEITTPPEEEEVTTVTEPETVETTPEEVTEVTTPESEETTPEETTTTAPDVPEEETTTTTTTTILIELEEEPPRDELILIDEEVPLGDTPFNTGVDNHIGLFITIGSLALLIGVGAQVYTVILKKNN